MKRINLPDGGHYTRYVGRNILEEWYDRECRLHRDDGPAWSSESDQTSHQEYYHHGVIHRIDGPAIIHDDGDIEYWVNGEIPLSILDIVIIQEEIDYDAFPSAELISNYYDGTDTGNRAYRISDPDELILAILRYS